VNTSTNHSFLRIPATQHGLRPELLSKAALQVITTLQEAGFAAYIVGGGVRDLLLGKHPKDFDVATDAHPEQIKPLFKRCLLIGRRFRLAHVYFGQHIIEVATFRSNIIMPTTEETTDAPEELRHHATTGMILRDNIYGTLEDDAWRRDFTINALYYDPTSGDIIDYTNGYQDLQQRTLRIIGDPAARYREDPVRMLRAIRFISKLNVTLHADTEAPIEKSASLIAHVSTSRLGDEFIKLFMNGHALDNFNLIKQYHLLKALFAQTAAALEADTTQTFAKLIEQALANTDERVKLYKPVTPAFLFAALLWKPYQLSSLAFQEHHHQSPYIANLSAASEVISQENKQVGIPRRLAVFIRETWHLQNLLTSFRRRHINRVVKHPRFRAAYDFLALRAASGEDCQEAVSWWTDYQAANDQDRHELLRQLPKAKPI
jgi:poly(A) polymerase